MVLSQTINGFGRLSLTYKGLCYWHDVPSYLCAIHVFALLLSRPTAVLGEHYQYSGFQRFSLCFTYPT